MVTIIVSASVNLEQHSIAKANGWGWSELIRAGIGAKLKPSSMLDKLGMMEAKIEALERQRRRIPESIRQQFQVKA